MEYHKRIREVLLSGKRKTIKGDRLVERLCKKTGLGRDQVIVALSQLRQTGELACASWFRGEPIGQVQINIAKKQSKLEERWERTLIAAGVSEPDRDALLEISEILVGLDDHDLSMLLRGLEYIRKNIENLRGTSRYLVSARHLLGSSKLLDALPSAALRKYGIDLNVFEGPPTYLISAGPTNPDCVVLVENPQALELALLHNEQSNIAWIATFGYGLSKSGNENGQQLARLIGSGESITALVRSGSPPPLMQLLRHEKLFFWGDLDKEGLRIYWRLKKRYSNLKLSGLYHPMLSMLEKGSLHHPYIQLVAKPNQSCWDCSEPEVHRLLEACKTRAFDQEGIEVRFFEKYGGTEFSL